LKERLASDCLWRARRERAAKSASLGLRLQLGVVCVVGAAREMKSVILAVFVGVVASTAAFTPAGVVRAAVRASGTKVIVAAVDPAVDYDAMDVDALEKEIEAARRRLFDMRLEKRQQAKRANFKSSEVRELKAKVARMMPFYEAKLDGDARSGTTRAAKRSMAKERRALKLEKEAA